LASIAVVVGQPIGKTGRSIGHAAKGCLIFHRIRRCSCVTRMCHQMTTAIGEMLDADRLLCSSTHKQTPHDEWKVPD
jgi:hypothetical protein